MENQYDPVLLQTLCEQASRETDSAKLLELTRQISELLDRKLGHPPDQPAAKKSA